MLRISDDKILHMLGGICLFSFFHCLFFYLHVNLILMLAIAIGKESYDYVDYGLFDSADIGATMIGWVTGLSIILPISSLLERFL